MIPEFVHRHRTRNGLFVFFFCLLLFYPVIFACFYILLPSVFYVILLFPYTLYFSFCIDSPCCYTSLMSFPCFFLGFLVGFGEANSIFSCFSCLVIYYTVPDAVWPARHASCCPHEHGGQAHTPTEFDTGHHFVPFFVFLTAHLFCSTKIFVSALPIQGRPKRGPAHYFCIVGMIMGSVTALGEPAWATLRTALWPSFLFVRYIDMRNTVQREAARSLQVGQEANAVRASVRTGPDMDMGKVSCAS